MVQKRIPPDTGNVEAYLTATEKQLFDEFVSTAKTMDKRGVMRCYGLLAEVAEETSRLKTNGESALPLIARGIDALRELDANHKQEKKTTRRNSRLDFLENWQTPIGFALAGFYMLLIALAFIVSFYFFDNKMDVAGYISQAVGWIMFILGYLALSAVDN